MDRFIRDERKVAGISINEFVSSFCHLNYTNLDT